MRRLRVKWGVSLCVLVFQGAFAQGIDPWKAPAVSTAPAQLPRLSQPLVLDGDLAEWQTAAAVPVRNKSDLVLVRSPHEWRGASDLGMEVYCAWNTNGLCVGAIVADDEAINRQADQNLWQQDCLEIFVDGRSANSFMKPPYSAGAYQLFVRPPLDGKPPAIVVNSRHGRIDGLKVGGKPTRAGYNVEALIPWSAFPGLDARRGKRLGLQFQLDDYDSRDEKLLQPACMNCRGVRNLSASPQNLRAWELVDALKTGPKAQLDPMVALDSPRIIGDSKSVVIPAEVCALLGARTHSMSFVVTDNAGRKVFDRVARASSARGPWGKAVRAEAELRVSDLNQGYHLVTLTVSDREGHSLGSVVRPVLCARGALDEMFARVEKANPSALAGTQPFKAAAGLAAAVCIERFKRGVELGDTAMTEWAVREFNARAAALETGSLPAGDWGIFDLIALSANPDAQVVVEYPRANSAAATFYWGAMPLCSVTINQMPDREEAEKVIESPKRQFWAEQSEKTTFAGKQARHAMTDYVFSPCSLDEFAADKHVAMIVQSKKVVDRLDLANLAWAVPEAAVILDDCPDSVRDTVQEWAKTSNVPVLALSDAWPKGSILVAGNPRSTNVFEKIKTYGTFAASQAEHGHRIAVASENRVITAASSLRETAEHALALVLAGKAVSPAETDELRRQLVGGLAPTVSAPPLPPGMKVFCGDVHAHTFHSDGSPSPAALCLQAMHCYLDFLVISDHNTVDGALVAKKLLSQHGIAYPAIVGEEITMNWAHMNAFPLKEFVSQFLSPWETMKAAHKQGAVIQWNHPGSFDGQWFNAHGATGLAGTSLDAWEHIPALYHEWKQADALPVIVGSTDTHSCTFQSPERTIVIAPSADGADVAEAIRAGKAVAAAAFGSEFFYGSDWTASYAWSALAEGAALKTAKADAIRRYFKKADLPSLLRASSPRVEPKQ